MGFLGLFVLLGLGYAAWKLASETDPQKKKAFLNSLFGYAATVALGFMAFRSGLFWLLGLIVVAHLLARAGLIKQKVNDARERVNPRPSSPKMSREKALEVLGVQEGASQDEIKARYKELMRRVHPDKGGSSYLATELNEAKRVLLG
jgi:hypothetical protein